MEKESRRTKITKLLLTDSFLRLLEEKSLSRVTVKDICEDADLNRSTYYRYYTDPYDQMAQLEVEIIEEMTARVNAQAATKGPSDDPSELTSVIKQILDYIYSKKDMFRILLGNHGDFNLQKDILAVLAEKLLPEDLQASENQNLLEKYTFISTGSFGVIYHWLMTDAQTSTKELAERIAQYCLTIFGD